MDFTSMSSMYLHGRSYLLLEHPVHQPLIGSSCVFEPKWHHTITIGSLRCDERGLFLVVWVHADLVVAGEGIHKTEQFMAGSGIHDEVDSRQRETCHARSPILPDWRILTESGARDYLLGLSFTGSFSELNLYLWVYKQFL